ncbi:MAG: hemerythrin domain-containing protein [Ottowia sp.]|uniref:hemerythrin domain-containing protein n=1 Tax=Ottowia sp. TaxID=1898956 RepID=UPI003C78C490
MRHRSLETIRDEHSSLAAMLQSMRMMVDRGPGDDPKKFFDVLRAMLFYIDEFPERLHHPKETELLFPAVLRNAPGAADAIARLDRDHEFTEKAVRDIQQLLLGWELLGEPRRPAFTEAFEKYVDLYLEHMRVEEQEVLPAAEKALSDAEWKALDDAFEKNRDPLTGGYEPGAEYDRLFTRIVMKAPAPIGLGE